MDERRGSLYAHTSPLEQATPRSYRTHSTHAHLRCNGGGGVGTPLRTFVEPPSPMHSAHTSELFPEPLGPRMRFSFGPGVTTQCKYVIKLCTSIRFTLPRTNPSASAPAVATVAAAPGADPGHSVGDIVAPPPPPPPAPAAYRFNAPPLRLPADAGASLSTSWLTCAPPVSPNTSASLFAIALARAMYKP